ncbi:hypothetical protein DL771_008752 [Monosporascus sp. 5C6A]|nr:hypothetical protein DL771_008752 [Monosporascus sp. 5C6A]
MRPRPPRCRLRLRLRVCGGGGGGGGSPSAGARDEGVVVFFLLAHLLLLLLLVLAGVRVLHILVGAAAVAREVGPRARGRGVVEGPGRGRLGVVVLARLLVALYRGRETDARVRVWWAVVVLVLVGEEKRRGRGLLRLGRRSQGRRPPILVRGYVFGRERERRWGSAEHGSSVVGRLGWFKSETPCSLDRFG